ncbi:MAG: radical SAM protein [Candidatus Omnitrophica bacterium]|nr:radical SAM protein [Candidatus Omnitrophota bacterium]
MKLCDKISVALNILQKRLRKRKLPLLISWYITERCNYQCKYCNIWKKDIEEELNSDQIKYIIDKLLECGTKAISFSGGEPLLREDIEEIIGYCKQKGIYVKMTTNGSLVRNKIQAIRNIDSIILSFDGPPEIHDFHRQAGSYDTVMDATRILKEHKIKVGFNCVMSKYNIGHLNYILARAEELKAKVTFQPFEFRTEKEFLANSAPSESEYRAALNMLIAKKKRGNPAIAYSLPVLQYLYNWPSYKKIECWAGIFHFRITADGRLLACDRLTESQSSVFLLKGNIKNIIAEMKTAPCRDGCWRGSTMDLNYVLSFHPHAILNAINIF